MERKSATRMVAENEFEKLCQKVPKDGFYFIGIKHIGGDEKRPEAFIKKINEDTLQDAILNALNLLMSRIKTTPSEPLCFFAKGKLKRNFTERKTLKN